MSVGVLPRLKELSVLNKRSFLDNGSGAFMQACAIPSVWLKGSSNMECIIPRAKKNICV